LKQQNSSTTSKKVRVAGIETYINAETGEIQEMQVTSIEERDFNFHKVWMRQFIYTIDLVGNQKTRLAFWIIDHLNKENQLTMTYRQIAEQTQISLDTVRTTMKILLDADFLRKINMGVYAVNPDIIYKGSRTGRLNVLNQYTQLREDASEDEQKISDEEQLANLVQSIKILTEKANELAKKIESSKSENESESKEADESSESGSESESESNE
jgi:DNA-binding Lrp family transcriptional regulator